MTAHDTPKAADPEAVAIPNDVLWIVKRLTTPGRSVRSIRKETHVTQSTLWSLMAIEAEAGSVSLSWLRETLSDLQTNASRIVADYLEGRDRLETANALGLTRDYVTNVITRAKRAGKLPQDLNVRSDAHQLLSRISPVARIWLMQKATENQNFETTSTACLIATVADIIEDAAIEDVLKNGR